MLAIVDCTHVCVDCPHAILAQDIFSLGCVIAEVFLEGTAVFDLSKVRLARSFAVSMQHEAMRSLTDVNCCCWLRACIT